MRHPLVSVIIPVRNGEKTLRRCLNSVLHQTYDDYEVIVVDNNSTDRTKDIIASFQNRSGKISYVFESRPGRGAARNAGIRKAKGAIIAMTDSDCVVPFNWLEQLTEPIIHENEDVVVGFENDLVKNFWTRNIQKANWRFLKRCTRGNYVKNLDTKNFAIKSHIMKRLMFDPGLMNLEDFDLALRMDDLKIRSVPEIRVGHHHKGSFFDVVRMNFDRAYWTMKIYKKHRLNPELRKAAMFGSISTENILGFSYRIVLQFLERPVGESFFILVSETAWRIGLLWG